MKFSLNTVDESCFKSKDNVLIETSIHYLKKSDLLKREIFDEEMIGWFDKKTSKLGVF